MWLGADSGVYRIGDGAVTRIGEQQKIQGFTIAQDTAGDVWLTNRTDVFRYRNGRIQETVHPGLGSPVISIYCDRPGNLWMGTEASGYCRWRNQRMTCFKGSGPDGNYVVAFYEDRSGALWVGTQNGVERWRDGARVKWTTRDGLASDQLASFYETASGSLWIGAENGGLSRYKDGRFSRVTTDNGLFDSVAFAILPDGDGNLWMSCNRGIYRVSLRELEECADGRRKTVRSYSYGVADGMLSREGNGAFPAGWRSTDGRLWFATVNGAAVIDPRLIGAGRPPNVAIEETLVDGRGVTGRRIRVGRHEESLEIRYTALRCSRPKEAHFKVKLEGLDSDWTDMGVRRSVHYSHLPPGQYTFRVVADNGEDIWNLKGAGLELSIAGPFYKTGWFLTLCALTLALAVTASWRLRVAGLIKAREQQRQFLRRLIDSQEQERRRLARELHDGLAQRLTVMKNLALMIGRAPDGARNGRVEIIAGEAGEALREVREISHALRPYQLDYLGLKEALEALVEKVAGSTATKFRYEMADVQELLDKDAQVNIYRIVQECLQNIVKHAHASNAQLTLAHYGSRVRLEIADDGKGFGPEGNHAGLGLTSISERVELLGGRIEIASQPGKGTRIHIELGRAPDSS